MPANSVMKLINYKVLKTSFILSDKFQFKDQKMNINHQFKRDINKIDQNNYGIILSFEILQQSNNDIVPFDLEVSIMGVFELKNWEDKNNVDMAINNATAILFPYLRNLVSTVTLNGNVAPYLLPVMNVVELFNKQENK